MGPKTKAFALGRDPVVWMLGLAIIALFYQLDPLLSNRLLSSWDLPTHYYLTARMTEYLRDGSFSGYNPYWFTGYDEFAVCGPLPYVLAALPHLLSFQLIPLILSFNLLVFSVPFALLFSFLALARSLFGSRSTAAALFAGLIFLAYPRLFFSNFIGLPGLVSAGVLPNYVALTFLLLGLAYTERVLQRSSLSDWTLATLCFSATLLSHLITAGFGAVFVVLWVLFRGGRRWYWGLTAPAAAPLICWPWFGEFLHHLHFATLSGVTLGEYSPDILSVLFPEFSLVTLQHWAKTAWQAFIQYPDTDLAATLIRHFPFIGCFYFCFGLAGLLLLYRSTGKDRRFFYIFVLALLILPRNFLNDFFGVAHRPYRANQILVLFFSLVAGYGVSQSWDLLRQQNSLRRLCGRTILSCFLALGLFVSWFQRLDTRYLSGTPQETRAPRYLDQGTAYSAAMNLIRNLEARQPQGRIIAEQGAHLIPLLGTPRFFSLAVPLLGNLPILNGFPEEASLGSAYIFNPLYLGSQQMRWISLEIWNNPVFNQQPMEEMLRRLALLGTEYIVATSAQYTAALQLVDPEIVELVYAVEPFALFKLQQYRPPAYKLNQKPLLYFNRGGVPFREMSKGWFIAPQLYQVPIVEALNGGSPRCDQAASFRALVLFLDNLTAEDERQIEEWAACFPKVMLLSIRKLQAPICSSISCIWGKSAPEIFDRLQSQVIMDSSVLEVLGQPSAAYTPTVRYNEKLGDVFLNFCYSKRLGLDSARVFLTNTGSIYLAEQTPHN